MLNPNTSPGELKGVAPASNVDPQAIISRLEESLPPPELNLLEYYPTSLLARVRESNLSSLTEVSVFDETNPETNSQNNRELRDSLTSAGIISPTQGDLLLASAAQRLCDTEPPNVWETPNTNMSLLRLEGAALLRAVTETMVPQNQQMPGKNIYYIKLLTTPPEVMNSPHWAKRFVAIRDLAVAIFTMMDHPNNFSSGIIGYLDTHTRDGKGQFGPDLLIAAAQAMDRETLPEGETRAQGFSMFERAQEIIAVLNYLKEQGNLYRDQKS